MSKKKKPDFKFSEMISSILDDINKAKKDSEKVHKAGNIKTSGDTVENLIREKISEFLPERYLVKQGHLVNADGLVSNQLDIIIFDRQNTPKFFETEKTVFYPIESVLAIGEIKKTLRKNDIIEFAKKIKFIKKDMNRKLIPNPVFEGAIQPNATIFDLAFMRTDLRFKNPLFSFILSIDTDSIENLEFDDSRQYMPNDIYILNYGFFIYGDFKEKNFIAKIEDEEPNMDKFILVEKGGIHCLSSLLNALISHLNKCVVQPFSISHYISSSEEFQIRGKDVKFFKINDPKKV